jgi:hypothetical protein
MFDEASVVLTEKGEMVFTELGFENPVRVKDTRVGVETLAAKALLIIKVLLAKKVLSEIVALL